MERVLFALLLASALSVQGFDKIRAVNLGGWLVIEKWIKPSLFDAIPNGDTLDGTQIQLKSASLGTFVCAEGGGGSILSVNRSAASGWETFKLWRVTSTEYQLRVFDNSFVSANKGVVDARKASPGTLETFTLERNQQSGNRVHLRASDGTYLQAKLPSLLTADYSGQPDWKDDNPAVFDMYFTGTTFGGEFQLSNGYGPSKAASVLKEHRDTFVGEEDFKFMSQNQVNAVRIPVGWWIAYDPSPPWPFVQGSLAALDNAFSWARKWNIGVIIDLHAAPGSQNPWEHSANRDGVPTWTSHIPQTLEVIGFLAERYSKHPTLLGIELLNEPTSDHVSLDVLSKYYIQGYKVMRNYSETAFVIMCQRLGEVDPSELVNLMTRNNGYSNVVLDIHLYNLFSSTFANKSAQWNIDYVNTERTREVQSLNNGGATIFVGEWTNEWNVASPTNADYERFGDAQLAVYGNASFGWSYWCLKNVNLHWDFRSSVKSGYLKRRSNGGWPG